ncbi:MAG: uracil-DNA glycosylase [Armatimonadota bacterium]
MTASTLPTDWRDALAEPLSAESFRRLESFLAEEDAHATVLPPPTQRTAAFDATPLDTVRVVLLGQDPYPTPGHAHGLAFSVAPGTRPLPPSLRNLFREFADDLGCPVPSSGTLSPWSARGVLLLNTVLTVRAGEARSHAGRGWETFTDGVIDTLVARDRPVVFLLLGKDASAKAERVRAPHRVVSAPHPSPLARNRSTGRAAILGTRPFSRVNAALEELGLDPIDWRLP